MPGRASRNDPHTDPEGLPTSLEQDLIRHARVLPLDVVEQKGNGHAGTAVSLTPLLTALYARHLRHDPAEPLWPGRDRFILSCGHASLALYVQLFLWGYGIGMADLRDTRRLGSLTPGHPERGVTPGVEMSTGPLGQGFAAAVGSAMEERRVGELLAPGGAPEDNPLGHRTWCLVSDGDLSEGISAEAAALAGRVGLPRLVVLWDDNGITIDGSLARSTIEDFPARFIAAGWRVLTLGNTEDPEEVDRILVEVCRRDPGDTRPTFVRVRTRIGHPMPNIGGTPRAHAGPVGAEEVQRTKALLGLDPSKSFDMPGELLEAARRHGLERGRRLRGDWEREVAAWRRRDPRAGTLLDRLVARRLPEGWRSSVPGFPERDLATRVASGRILAGLGEVLPELWGGSCDLSSSTSTVLPDGGDFTPEYAGSTVHFGIREHAQAAALSGMALSGLTRPVGSTYLVFSDYQRPAIRLSALMGLPTVFIWTHDSLAVGEDGPTHQPVEQIASLRTVPGLSIVRPADAWETAASWERILGLSEGPVGLVLSRQSLPVLAGEQKTIARGVPRGAYALADFPCGTAGDGAVARAGDGPTQGNDGMTAPDLRVLILASGAEVHVALGARRLLADAGVPARVVSVPCLEWFEAQPEGYREEVLPRSVRARVSVEAGVSQPWGRLVGADGASVSVEGFGRSGDGAQQLADAGFTPEHVADVCLDTLARVR